MKTHKLILVTLLVLCVHFTNGHSDFTKISFRSITVEDGLSQSAVFAVEQDRTGFLWIGTADGLNRYDGYEFKHYRHEPGNPNSISDNFIMAIEESANGNLWVGTYGGGLNRFEPNTGHFRNYLKSDEFDIASNDIYALHYFNNKLFIGTSNGLSIFDFETESFESYDYSGTFEYEVFSFVEINERLFLASSYGLLYLNESKNELFALDKGDFAQLHDYAIKSVLQAKNGYCWIGTDYGLAIIDDEGKRVEEVDLSELNGILVNSLLEDSEGHIWIGTNGDGIKIYDPNTKKLYNAQHNQYDNMSVSDNTINCLLEDRSGVVWIGTYGGYINKYDKYLNQFQLYTHQRGNLKGLNSRRVFALYQEGNDIWVGTDGGGLNRIIQNNNANEESHYEFYMTPSGLTSNSVWAIEPTGDNLYIGTLGGGLNLFNKNTGKAEALIQDTSNGFDLGFNYIYSLSVDADSLLWIGSDAGISLYEPKKKRFQNFSLDSTDNRTFSKNTVLAILHDSKGRHWLGTFGGGLTWFDSKTQKRIKRFRHQRDNARTLSYDKIMCVFEDSKQRIWVGTFGGGLNLFDERTQTFTNYTHNDGLPNDVIYGILEDENGYLWLSTNKGISRFNPEEITFKNFDYSNNLQSDEFNQGAFCAGQNGFFYFGGINGFNAFNPLSLNENGYAPEVLIKAFSKPGNEIGSSIGSSVNEIRLRYPNNSIIFEFVGFNYVSSSNNKYKYQLEGYSKEWIVPGDQRVAAYTNLEAGEYVFKTMASNNDGVWNRHPATIKLIVTAPLYKKSWFQTVMFLLILIVIISITVLVISNVRSRAKQELAETKLRASNAERESIQHQLTSLRAQMDPHFIFNSLNSIQHFIAQHETKQARQYLSKFASLIRQILNNSREETITVAEELDALKLYIELEQLRFDNKFAFELKTSEDFDEDEEDIPSMLIQPYVENAIIHGLKNKDGKDGLLKIELELKGEFLKIAIEDNGVGRVAAKEIRQKKLSKYKSLGMSVTQSRLQLWSESNQPVVRILDLSDSNNKPIGTRVEIEVRRGRFVEP